MDNWRKTKEWTFPFGPDTKKETLKEPGTLIRISRLHPAVGKQLALTFFQNSLVKKIESAYALFLAADLTIQVNKRRANYSLPSLATKRITPARKQLKVDGVDVLIIAGLAPKDCREPQGWYVFCNGRMILEADKSNLSGWGEDRFPNFHGKFNHFLGFVFFSSHNLDKPPWTTTKSAVVKDSPAYLAALSEMKIQARPIINFLSSFYPSEREEEKVVQREALFDTEPTPVAKLPRRQSPFSVKPLRRAPDKAVISYKKLRSELDEVKMRIGRPRMSNKEVGEYTFEYYQEKECD